MGDSAKSIMMSMIPIGVLFVIIIIYAIYRRSHTAKTNKSTAEANAIIEAQAMLAKMQKEQAEKDAKKPENETEKSEEKDTEDKPDEKKPMSQNTNSKKEKPKADAPISDTTDLEPDIDKTEA